MRSQWNVWRWRLVEIEWIKLWAHSTQQYVCLFYNTFAYSIHACEMKTIRYNFDLLYSERIAFIWSIPSHKTLILFTLHFFPPLSSIQANVVCYEK